LNNKTTKIAWFPAHPAQVWLMHAIKKKLEETDPYIQHIWVVRDKDITLKLLDSLGQKYIHLSKAGKGLLFNAIEMLFATIKTIYITRKYGITLWFTKYGSGNIGARLLGKKSISFNDDDIDVVPLIAKTSYPFANRLIFPLATRVGKYQDKSIQYDACHELVYLHPDRFIPDKQVVDRLGINTAKPYCILRLSALTSHHDIGKTGISDKLLGKIVELCLINGRTPILSSERKLPRDLKEYEITLPIDQIHHAIAYAEFYAGDSQSMALESATLGTPTFRFSDFSTISVINEFEKHGLIKSYESKDETEFLRVILQIIKNPSAKEEWNRNWHVFVKQKEDPLPIFVATIKALIEE
jgi:uncharacterized protein